MSSLKIGIDPGASGAIVVLSNGVPIEWSLMPTMQVGSATRVNAAELARMLKTAIAVDIPVEAYLEQVGAMPGQGVSSMFNFGHSCGVVYGVLGALEIPVTMVTPQRWKKAAGLMGTEKDAARSRAIQIWPAWGALSKKGAGQALADAALIALHGGPK